MPTVFVANFSFESELAGATPRQLERFSAIHRRFAPVWLSCAADGDLLLVPGCPRPTRLLSGNEVTNRFDFPELPVVGWEGPTDTGPREPALPGKPSLAPSVPTGLRWMPWGWSSSVADVARQRSPEQRIPPIDVVKQVNDRRFAASLESGHDRHASVSRIAGSVAEIEGAMAELAREHGMDSDASFLIKSCLSSSGRDRLEVRGCISLSAAAWLRRMLARDGAVIVEPRLERIAEAGLQFEVPFEGPPELAAVTELFTDEKGRLLGTRATLDIGNRFDDWQPAVDEARAACRTIRDLGYFGPVGFDVMRYRTPSGMIELRPFQDVNARWTMGRMAWEFATRFDLAECVLWQANQPPPFPPLTGPRKQWLASPLPTLSTAASRVAPFTLYAPP